LKPRSFVERQFIPQGPGPPQRPHMPGAADSEDLLDSAPTANTLSARLVFFDPHLGHSTGSRLDIDFTSRSNFSSHDGQEYS
jgi:hypothetical protein